MPTTALPLMKGFATPEGTRRYAERFAGRAAKGHFHEREGLLLSSIGIGTYLGEPDAATDEAYTAAIVAAVEGGVNVIDSAINYRFQRSERSIGAALQKLAAASFSREELLLCSKGGFLTPDGAMPADPGDYFFREFVETGIFRIDEIAADCHCLAPRYLENQLERSLRNFGVEAVDVYYVHNPETQLGQFARDEFHPRIRAAFEMLESAVAAGRVRFYGLATWNGFRQAEEAQDYLSLAEIVGLAREIGGDAHHFRFVQLPFNLAMTEALTRANQSVDGRQMSMVEAARALGVALVASASLLQGQLIRNLPEFIALALGLESDLERALQFVRSSPGITTALVGMSRAEHVAVDLKLVGIEPASFEQYSRLFQRSEPA